MLSTTKLRKIEKADEPLAPGEGQFNIMDPTGHSILRWDRNDKSSIEDAEKMFNDLLKRGYQAFEFSPVAQGKGKKVVKFNPNLNELIMVPMIAGG